MRVHKMLSIHGLFLAIALLAAGFVQAETSAAAGDEIVLKNGSRLLGTVTGARDGVLTIETDFAGTLSIAMYQIESVKTGAPVVVLMKNESVVSDTPLVIRDEQLEIDSLDQSFPLEDLLVVNPEPWELGIGYKWTGTFGLALAIERGNTDTDELDVDMQTVWRSKRDRFTFKWMSEQDKANNDKTKDTWQAVGKYDYFNLLADPNYVGMATLAESDKFQDLDLRYLIGPYFGRQFYEEPIFSLSGELGLSYVNEEYDMADDQDYGASMWNVQASSNYLGGDSKLFFDQFGVWNLKDTSDVIVNSTFGLSFPLLWRLEAAAEVLFEYDSGAVEDVDDLDQTYKFRVGYSW